MVCVLLIAIPFFSGIAAFFIRRDLIRRGLLVVVSGVHLGLAGLIWRQGTETILRGWFAFDPLGLLFLTVTSVLFFGAAIYAVRYLSDESRGMMDGQQSPGQHSRETTFSGCLLLLLATMTLVIGSQHLAVLWVGIEATTLASAPLIYFHRNKRSLEATWKYLLICSVGIAIALLSIYFLAVANNNQGELLLSKLLANAGELNLPWLKAAFLLLFVGYGTKMGLAPFHTWLPDAHSEAPSVVSALLSGALLNCAFLGILRAYQVCVAAGLASYCGEIFIVFGLLSIVFGAIFILGQADYKRMLAYSSVEQMGIITLGVGLGGRAVFGALVSMLSHSLTKAGLFLVAGNILSYFQTKRISGIQGLIGGKTRWTGILWLTGFLLITGTPPSGVFLGKIIILKESLFQGRYWLVAAFLLTLAIVFIGMARIFIWMTQGPATEEDKPADKYAGQSFWRAVVPAIFFILVIAMGLYYSAWLARATEEAARTLGGW